MWNGRRNAFVGLSALVAFLALELGAAATLIGSILELIVGIDVPLLPFIDSSD